jgi:hypothetical protein
MAAPPAVPVYTIDQWLDQYKAYLADLGNVGSRYATANAFYLSVISALLGILALTESTKLLGMVPRSTLWVVCLFASVICIVWTRTLGFYRRLFAAKFQVIDQLEAHLPHACFANEYRFLQAKGATNLLRIDRFAPIVLMLFFIALAIVRSVR